VIDPSGGNSAQVRADSGTDSGPSARFASDSSAGRESPPIRFMAEVAPDADPAAVILTCANCGAAMDERKCKLICRCGYFLSCSDYY
jgi:hypothetical protein